jgi:putative ABC transport system permease protein
VGRLRRRGFQGPAGHLNGPTPMPRVAFGRQLRSLIWKTSVPEEVEAELQFHVDMRTEEYVARGMEPGQARAAALARFGNIGDVEKACRKIGSRREESMRRAEWLAELGQDLRYAVRQLIQNRGFTAVAVLTLALGIGANSAVFSVVNAVLLRPLGYDSPDQLVMVWTGEAGTEGSSSAPDFLEWRERARSFESIAGISNASYALTGEGPAQRVRGMQVSANFFTVLRAPAAVGRTFFAGEDQSGAPKVAVLGYDFWRSHFGGDPRVVGREIRLDGELYTVVGVDRPGLNFSRTEVWTPLVFSPDRLTAMARGSRYLGVLGRLRPGVSVSQAGAELNRIQSDLAARFPDTNADAPIVTVVPLKEQVVGLVEPALLVLLGAVALVLLIACVNVANLQLVRATGRRAEVAVRTALGASRSRLLRQLLTESVVLAVISGVAGLILGAWGTRLLMRLADGAVPRAAEVGLDGRVVAFTMLVALGTGLLFGLVPALQASRSDVATALREGGRSGSAGPRANRLRSSLVVGELALALVLLVGAGLLIKSFYRLQHVDPGFEPTGLLTFDLSLPETKYATTDAQRRFADELLERMQRLPRARSAALIFGVPFGGMNRSGTFKIGGRPVPAPGQEPESEFYSTSPSYFATMSIPILRGRAFTEQDRSRRPGAFVIDQSAARRFFPNEDPIGRQIMLDAEVDGVPLSGEVVGIAGEVRHDDLSRHPEPQIYVPLATDPSPRLTVVIRSQGDPSLLTKTAEAVVRALDPDLPVYGVQTMTDRLSQSVGRPRLYTVLLAIFAGVALSLAAVGIYGVMSYAVSQRAHELGIRIALGAERRDVWQLVVGQGMLLTCIGLGIGVVLAALATRVVRSLLFGVGPTDAVTYGMVAGVLASVALVACYVPARRAARVDPMDALRAG